MIILTVNEKKLVKQLESHGFKIDRESIKRGQYDYSEQSRLDTPTPFIPSEDEFVLQFTGKNRGYDFSATLLLSCIRELTQWTSPTSANMTDYPEMVREGDWSGVRDTSEEKLWEIFRRFVLWPNS